VYDCNYHIVFCPKYRRKVHTAPIDARLKELLKSKDEQLFCRTVGSVSLETVKLYIEQQKER
jgi:putative transposase